MDPFTLAAVGAALGYAKGEMVDRPRENRERRVAAETQRWSPWTGMQAGPIKAADSFGTTLQGGMTGAALGQSMQASKLYQDQLAKQAAASAAASSGAGAGANLGLTMPAGYQGPQALVQPNPYQDLYSQSPWLQMPRGW